MFLEYLLKSGPKRVISGKESNKQVARCDRRDSARDDHAALHDLGLPLTGPSPGALATERQEG